MKRSSSSNQPPNLRGSGPSTADVSSTSGCPFLSRAGREPDRSIESIIKYIVHNKLHQPNVDISQWVKLCRQNLILSASTLARLRPARLRDLKLPLLLEQELEAYCESTPKKSRTKKTSERTEKDLARNATPKVKNMPKPVSTPVAFGLDENMRTIVKSCWNALASSHETGVGSPLHQFFVQFYQNFFEGDHRGRALFEGRSIVAQAQVLMRMITTIIHALDEPHLLIPVLRNLGVRHLIYGVERRNFQSWGLALAKTLESVLGPQICTREAKEAWFLLIQGLSDVMMQDYEQIANGYSGELYKCENNSWRLYDVIMTHEKLALYKDAEHTRLKEEIWLNLIDDIELIPMDNPAQTFPTQYAFRLSAGGALRVDLCALSENQLLKWMDDLSERIRAHQRAQPPAADENLAESGSTIGSSLSDLPQIDDLDEDIAVAEQGAHNNLSPTDGNSMSGEDSDDDSLSDYDADNLVINSEDDSDKRFSFVGFTGNRTSKSASSMPKDSPSADATRSKTISSAELGKNQVSSAPAEPKKKKNWRHRAEKKIKQLQASLQMKNASNQAAKFNATGKVQQ